MPVTVLLTCDMHPGDGGGQICEFQSRQGYIVRSCLKEEEGEEGEESAEEVKTSCLGALGTAW